MDPSKLMVLSGNLAMLMSAMEECSANTTDMLPLCSIPTSSAVGDLETDQLTSNNLAHQTEENAVELQIFSKIHL